MWVPHRMVCVLHSMESLWLCAHGSDAYATAETVNDADAFTDWRSTPNRMTNNNTVGSNTPIVCTAKRFFHSTSLRLVFQATQIETSADPQTNKSYGMLCVCVCVWVRRYQPSISDVLCLRIEMNRSQRNVRFIRGALERCLPYKSQATRQQRGTCRVSHEEHFVCTAPPRNPWMNFFDFVFCFFLFLANFNLICEPRECISAI